jgi:Fe-Mn family superoxide dismutase
MIFELPELPFETDALEPFISKKTIELHHAKHHRTYISNLNKLIVGTKYMNMDIETIIKLSDGPVYNNAAQVWNHSFYFEGIKPGNKKVLKGKFSEDLKHSFGSMSFLKNSFAKAEDSLFGVGWVWLILNADGIMEIIQQSNAGNPLRAGFIPLMACDMWEHAYYLDYQNSRTKYLEAFWNLINWEVIEERYKNAL